MRGVLALILVAFAPVAAIACGATAAPAPAVSPLARADAGPPARPVAANEPRPPSGFDDDTSEGLGGCRGGSLRRSKAQVAGPTTCVAEGARAVVQSVRVTAANGSELLVGIRGGRARLHVPGVAGVRAHVELLEPFEAVGSTPYDPAHLALVTTREVRVHPTLVLGPRTLVRGVAYERRVFATVPFGDNLAIRGAEVPCDALGLAEPTDEIWDETSGDERTQAKPRGELVPPKNLFRASWKDDAFLVKESPGAKEGLRIGPYDDEMWSALGKAGGQTLDFELFGRARGHVDVELRTVGGTVIRGWIPEAILSPQKDANPSGRGEGIGLCGCPPIGNADAVAGEGVRRVELVRGAVVHEQLAGAAWAKVSKRVKVTVAATDSPDWLQVRAVPGLFQPGDGECPQLELERAFVRTADVVERPRPR